MRTWQDQQSTHASAGSLSLKAAAAGVLPSSLDGLGKRVVYSTPRDYLGKGRTRMAVRQIDLLQGTLDRPCLSSGGKVQSRQHPA